VRSCPSMRTGTARPPLGGQAHVAIRLAIRSLSSGRPRCGFVHSIRRSQVRGLSRPQLPGAPPDPSSTSSPSRGSGPAAAQEARFARSIQRRSHALAGPSARYWAMSCWAPRRAGLEPAPTGGEPALRRSGLSSRRGVAGERHELPGAWDHAAAPSSRRQSWSSGGPPRQSATPGTPSHRQLGMLGVVTDRLPGGQLRIADSQHPLGWNLADQLGRRHTQHAPTVRATHRELHHQIALPRMVAVAPPRPRPAQRAARR